MSWKSLKVIMAGLAISASGAVPAAAQDIGIEIGKKAPAAAVLSADGKMVDLGDYIGKGPVLIEFWATWCPVCKDLQPTMIDLHAKYGSKVAFVNVAVSVNQTPALIKRYLGSHKMPGDHVYDSRGNATGAYDVPATSYIVLVDKSGTVVYTGVGADQGPKLEAAIKKLQ